MEEIHQYESKREMVEIKRKEYLIIRERDGNQWQKWQTGPYIREHLNMAL